MRTVDITTRLEPAELIEEDCRIWFDVHFRLGRPASFLWTRSLMQDGRDATLMLTAQRFRCLGIRECMHTPDPYPLGWIAAGGDLP